MIRAEAFAYKDRDKAYITVRTIEEPYGEGSEPVVSVGCTLKGNLEDPTWKVHIPMGMLKAVALSLYQRSPDVQAQLVLEDADARQRERAVISRMNQELRAVQMLSDEREDEES